MCSKLPQTDSALDSSFLTSLLLTRSSFSPCRALADDQAGWTAQPKCTYTLLAASCCCCCCWMNAAPLLSTSVFFFPLPRRDLILKACNACCCCCCCKLWKESRQQTESPTPDCTHARADSILDLYTLACYRIQTLTLPRLWRMGSSGPNRFQLDECALLDMAKDWRRPSYVWFRLMERVASSLLDVNQLPRRSERSLL